MLHVLKVGCVENQAGYIMETSAADPTYHILVLSIVAVVADVKAALANYGDHRGDNSPALEYSSVERHHTLLFSTIYHPNIEDLFRSVTVSSHSLDALTAS